MKEDENLSITRRGMRLFAESIESGKLGPKYSYHNFYTRLVRKLIVLGFIDKHAIWNPKKGTTMRVYQLKIQQIPKRPPDSGFVKQAWQVAKSWNELVQR